MGGWGGRLASAVSCLQRRQGGAKQESGFSISIIPAASTRHTQHMPQHARLQAPPAASACMSQRLSPWPPAPEHHTTPPRHRQRTVCCPGASLRPAWYSPPGAAAGSFHRPCRAHMNRSVTQAGDTLLVSQVFQIQRPARDRGGGHGTGGQVGWQQGGAASTAEAGSRICPSPQAE